MNSWNDPRWEEMTAALRSLLDKIERSQCLVVADPEHFPPNTKLLVTCGGDFRAEFTIIDSEKCKVLVKDSLNFPKATEGKLLGTKKRSDQSKPGSFQVGEWNLLPGRLLRLGLLAYEVRGKEYFADGIREIKITYPSGASFNFWSD